MVMTAQKDEIFGSIPFLLSHSRPTTRPVICCSVDMADVANDSRIGLLGFGGNNRIETTRECTQISAPSKEELDRGLGIVSCHTAPAAVRSETRRLGHRTIVSLGPRPSASANYVDATHETV